VTGRRQNTDADFWGRVEKKGPDECWPWLGSVKNGYGRFTQNYQEHYAHIRAHELEHGPAPAGMQVMHSCNNKICCNPAHLSAGTPTQNTNDAYRRSHRAKLTNAQAEAIRLDTRTQMAIAAAYGIGQSQVSRIKRGESRKYG
jgi:hypothetical protein